LKANISKNNALSFFLGKMISKFLFIKDIGFKSRKLCIPKETRFVNV